MLDHGGAPVGVLLLLYGLKSEAGETTVYCNLSSWYVEPAFRNYPPLLTKIAQKNKEVTYINISAATWTWPIIEMQGFRSYCSGPFFSIPALSHSGPKITIEDSWPKTDVIDGLFA